MPREDNEGAELFGLPVKTSTVVPRDEVWIGPLTVHVFPGGHMNVYPAAKWQITAPDAERPEQESDDAAPA